MKKKAFRLKYKAVMLNGTDEDKKPVEIKEEKPKKKKKAEK